MDSSYPQTLILIRQVFSPAKVIFAGVGVLLSVRSLFPLFARAICNSHIPQAAKDVRSSQEALVDIFERIKTFFHCLHYRGSDTRNDRHGKNHGRSAFYSWDCIQKRVKIANGITPESHLRPSDAPSTRQRGTLAQLTTISSFSSSSAPQVPSCHTSNDTWIVHLRRPMLQVHAASTAIISTSHVMCMTPYQSGPCSEPHQCWIHILVSLGTFRSHVRFLSPLDLDICSPFQSFLLYLSFSC